MGTLRFCLAIFVLAEHAGGSILGIHPLPGFVCVQAFYVISGFYMALILSTKYVGPDSLKAFYWNRFLRLFPTYWMVLAATLALMLCLYLNKEPMPPPEQAWLTAPHQLNGLVLAYAALVNVSLLGLDWLHFVPLNHDGQNPLDLGVLTLVPQAWTLGMEICFYLIAPRIIRLRWESLAGLIALSLACRFVSYALGLTDPVWIDRFFPFEIAFFLAGVLAFRVWHWLHAKAANPEIQSIIRALAAIFLVTLIYFAAHYWTILPAQNAPNSLPPKYWAFLLLVVFSLPFLFEASRESVFDNFIGQFSYPVYISHFLVLQAMGAMTLPESGVLDRGYFVAFWTLPLSAVLLLITVPFERARSANAKQRHATRLLLAT